MKKISKIGYLGPAGSYSQIAVEYLKPSGTHIAVNTISDVIKMVKNGQLDYGVIPIENSIQGGVLEAIDGLYQNKLFIEQELIVPINHCVASLDQEIKPEKVQGVMSHPQALWQCSKYINTNFPNAKKIETTSTAQAFKEIAEKGLVDTVAIGTLAAAKNYKLKVLKKNIQDKKNNETRFVLIKKTKNINSNGHKSSFVIIPPKDRPGLLFDILKNFKDNKINLCKIESRPSKSKLGTYIFHVDITGNFKNKAVQKAIGGIKKESHVLFLGNYDQVKLY